jgi:hypothetical protein
MLKIISLSKTCEACPSQWEGKTAEGKKVYIRYRWGRLTMYIDGQLEFNGTFGDNLDGYMTDTQMLEHIGLEFTGKILPS